MYNKLTSAAFGQRYCLTICKVKVEKKCINSLVVVGCILFYSIICNEKTSIN